MIEQSPICTVEQKFNMCIAEGCDPPPALIMKVAKSDAETVQLNEKPGIGAAYHAFHAYSIVCYFNSGFGASVEK